MPKFKIGDKVKYTGSDTVGVITGWVDIDTCQVVYENGKKHVNFVDSLRRAEPAIKEVKPASDYQSLLNRIKKLEEEVAYLKPVEYPCFMESKETGTVVLFTQRSEGTVVKKGPEDLLGYFSCCWEMDNFKPFKGTIEV